MVFGFSYVGLIFLVMLFVPNIIWTRKMPADYDKYVKGENRLLLALERIGEAAVCVIILIFDNFNLKKISPWLLWLAAALVMMALYEAFWIKYFKSARTMKDFYGDFLGIPVAGASLPVASALFIAIYGGNPFLLGFGIILGIGHIGIHLGHRKEVSEMEKDAEE